MPAPAKSRKTKRHRTRPDPAARALGAHVRELRKERDFSFDAFVEETGLGRGYVSELERGLVVPTIGTLAKIAAALELTVADLVLGDTPREQLFAATRVLSDVEVAAMLADVETKIGRRSLAVALSVDAEISRPPATARDTRRPGRPKRV